MRFFDCLFACIFYFTIVISTHGQFVERYFHPDTFSISRSITALDHHLYMSIGLAQDFEFNPKEQYILRLNRDLTTKDSVHVNPYFTLSADCDLYCGRIKPIGDNLIMALYSEVTEKSNSQSKTLIYSKSHVLLMDSTLSYVDYFTVQADSAIYLGLSDFSIKNDTLYMAGYMNDSIFQSWRAVIIKRTLDGSWVKTRTFSDSLFEDSGPILNNIRFYDNKILVSVNSTFGAFENYLVLDSQLELETVGNRVDTLGNDHLFFSGNGFVVTMPGQLPIFMGSSCLDSQFNPGYYFLMGTSRLDSNLRMTKIDTFPFSGSDHGDFTSSQPWYNGLSYKSADSVLMVMTGQRLFYGRTDSSGASDVFIYNYNATNGTLNWMKIYRTGYTQSYFASCEVLPNNTYLIGLNEYNWDKYNYPNMSAHLMILNAEGDILGREESYPFLNDPLSIYPNPVADDLRIEGLPAGQEPFHYKIWDAVGNKLGEGKVSEAAIIKTEGLPPGSLIIQVNGSSGFTQNIPLIKK